MKKLTIRVGNITSKIIEYIGPETQTALKKALSYIISGSQFSTYAQLGWDGTKNLFNTRNNTFPTGLLRKAREVLYSLDYEVILEDTRVKPTGFPILLKNVKLRDYQEECVKEMCRVGRGLIQVGTSGGKTIITSALLANLGVNSLVIVPTKELLKQTSRELSKFLGIKVGVIGDGERDIGKITVATFQSLTTSEEAKKRKYNYNNNKWETVNAKKIIIRPDLKEYLDSVECLYTDESHHLAASSLQQIYNACPNAFYRYGCSATPYKFSSEDAEVEAVTGRLLRKYSASYLIANKWISQPTIHLIQFKQERLPVRTPYAKAYEDRIIKNEKRNDLIKYIADSEASNGNSVLISVRQINHGEILYDLLRDKYGNKVIFLNSNVKSEEVTKSLKKLYNKEVLIVIATSILNEGISIESLDTLIFASCPKSAIITLQLVGRVLRRTKTKTTVNVYDIQDFGCKYLTSASKERVETYSTEPEFILKNEDFSMYA